MAYNINIGETDTSIGVSVFYIYLIFLISLIFSITIKDNGDIIKKSML